MHKLAAKKKCRSGRNRPVRASNASRWIFVLLGVVALGFQSFVVKPHFHIQDAGTPVAAAQDHGWTVAAIAQGLPVGVGGETSPKDPAGEDDPANVEFSECSMCQSAHQSGQFLRPTANTFSLQPQPLFRPIAFTQDAPAGTTVSFSWQGRAPPQV